MTNGQAMSIDELCRLETDVWAALVTGDARADGELLADNFLGVYPTGFADRDDHASQLEGGPTVERFEILDARMIEITPSALLLAYRATFSRPGADHDRPEAMYVSSLWCRRDGRWQNVFSQDTPTDGP